MCVFLLFFLSFFFFFWFVNLFGVNTDGIWHAFKYHNYLNSSDNVDDNKAGYLATESNIRMSGHGVMNLKFI